MKRVNSNTCCSKGSTEPSCCSGSDCCGTQSTKEVQKELKIDFLYLDLTTCERCQGTDSTLEDAIREVSSVLQAAGYQIKLNKVNVNTRELAIRHEFLSSPTIRINGIDIAMEVRESNCKDCGDLCGDAVDCRVWEYEGVEYTEPPKAMIVNAILSAVYGKQYHKKRATYILPDNLAHFYERIEQDQTEK